MDNSATDQEKLKNSLEILCLAIKNTNEETYPTWKQLAQATLELSEKIPQQLNHFKFQLSQITYNLVTRLLLPLQKFPQFCPLSLKLLHTLTTYDIDSPTFQLVTAFLSDPKKYYAATLQFSDDHHEGFKPNDLIAEASNILEDSENFLSNKPNGIPSLPIESTKRKYSDYYSLCILDLSGNFLLCDENSRKIFGRPQNKLKGKNLFRDLMIPFSLAALRKKYSGDVFQLFDGKLSSVFSFTIYSSDNIEKYTKELIAKCQQPLKKNLFGEEFTQKKDKVEVLMSNLIKQFADEESDAIYFKFLQNLTSKASLIDLQMTHTEIKDLLSKSSEEPNIGVEPGNVLQEFLAPCPEFDKQVIRTVVLLETRKAKHVQKFPYHLMTQDPKITYWLKKIEKKLVDLTQKAKVLKESQVLHHPFKKWKGRYNDEEEEEEEIYTYESPTRN